MARSASRLSSIAILAVIGYVIPSQFTAFVNSSPTRGSSHQLRSRVRLGPFKTEIAEAEKQVKFLLWAADTAHSKGMPQASMLQQKAADQAQALEVLKTQQANAGMGGSGFSAPAAASVAAPAAASVAAPVASGSAASKQEIDAAQRTADMLTWAAKTCAQKGLPQAAMMQAKANDAVAAVEAMKKGSPVPAATAPPSIAKEDCPVTPTMAGVTKEQIREAEKHAYLLSWAADTASKQGMPQAAELQTKAMQAVRNLEDLKACEDKSSSWAPASAAASPAAPMPVAAAAPAVASNSKVSKAEFVAAKKHADLLVWAARSASAQGMPQAAQMQANADAALAKMEAMANAL